MKGRYVHYLTMIVLLGLVGCTASLPASPTETPVPPTRTPSPVPPATPIPSPRPSPTLTPDDTDIADQPASDLVFELLGLTTCDLPAGFERYPAWMIDSTMQALAAQEVYQPGSYIYSGVFNPMTSEESSVHLGSLTDRGMQAYQDVWIAHPEEILARTTQPGSVVLFEDTFPVGDQARGGTGLVVQDDGQREQFETLIFLHGDVGVTVNHSYREGTQPQMTLLEIATLLDDRISRYLDTGRVDDIQPCTRMVSSVGEQGWILFAADPYGNYDLFRIPAAGGEPLQLTNDRSEEGFASWSPDGQYITFSSDRDGSSDIYVMDGDGRNVIQLTDDPAWDAFSAWSPDGQHIAFSSDRDGPDSQIYLMNTDGTDVIRLTDRPGDALMPLWSPDGSHIVFVSGRDGNADIYVMNADGSGVTQLTDTPQNEVAFDWSPDGTRLVYVVSDAGAAGEDIYVMNADGSNIVQLTFHLARDSEPSWSPDGSRIVFVSDRDQTFDLYVMDDDGSNVRHFWGNAPEKGMFDMVLEVAPAWQPASSQ